MRKPAVVEHPLFKEIHPKASSDLLKTVIILVVLGLFQIKLEIHTDLRKIFRLIGDAFFSDCIAVEIQSSFFLAASISCDGNRIPWSILMINSECNDTLAECYILKID